MNSIEEINNKSKNWDEYLGDYEFKSFIPSFLDKSIKPSYFKSSIGIPIVNKSQEKINAELLAAWVLLYNKYNNTDDIAFGITIPAKIENSRKSEKLYPQVVPLRVNTEDCSTAEDIINILSSDLEFIDLKQTEIMEYKYKNEEIFDTIIQINYCEENIQSEKSNNSEDLVTNIVINIFVNNKIDISITYNDKIEQAFIKRLVEHYKKIFESITANNKINLKDIGILSIEEQKEIIDKFNQSCVEHPNHISIYEMFEMQVDLHPNKTAMVFNESSLTYSQLNKYSNRIAWFLKENGIGENSRVCIATERSVEHVAALLGIIKAGATYVPVDPEYPQARIDYIIEDSSSDIMLIQKKNSSRITSQKTRVVSIEDICYNDSYSSNNLGQKYNPERLVYICYTSGSTGNPKGVMIKMNAFTNLVNWFTKGHFFSEEDCILVITATSFDLTQKCLFGCLVTGGKLCLFRPGMLDYEEMSNIIDKHKVSIVNCTPGAFYPLVDYNEDSDYIRLKSFRNVFIGGEAMNFSTIKKWTKSKNYNAEIINLYGPTECTDIASEYRIKNSEIDSIVTVPMGKPIHNYKFYILDKYEQPVPIGINGEIHIGGYGVAAGYLNNEQLTNEKFIECPHIAEGKLYKSGDIARWLPDGNMMFIGRKDNQVKLRGFRIELSEIEGHLLSHNNIRDAIVLPKGNKVQGEFLCAYIIENGQVTNEELKNYLSEKIPSFMVPSIYIRIESFKLNQNGKIDKKSLPEPSFEPVEQSLPKDEVEEKLLRIWKDILGTPNVGLDSNFFDLGGHSLSATQLLLRINKDFNLELSIIELFRNPVIEDMLKLIQSSINSK